MKPYVLSVFLMLTAFYATAQKGVSGLWEGTMTIGGLESAKTYPFELWLEQTGSKLRGKSYIHLDDGQVVQMSVEGKIYSDRSMSFEDVEFIASEGQLSPSFTRRYQLIHKRGIYDAGLEGYWQEITPQVLSRQRQLGRISLKKAKGSKA